MYNIDYDVEKNFFFGMDMSMKFMQARGGKAGPKNDQPMEFYFTGDDDVWVYVDGALFLDLSGIHRHVGGKIDFVNGKVFYYALDTTTGDVSATPYATYTFETLLQAAGKSTDVLNAKGTFKDYTFHDFKFFYMERGSGSSVCRIEFNFPVKGSHTVQVGKAITGDTDIVGTDTIDYKFQVLKVDDNGNKTQVPFVTTGTQYAIYQGTNKVGTGTVGANGIFTLKAGQVAEFQNIQEDAGRYYVRELFDPSDFAQYDDVKVVISNQATTTNKNGTVTIGDVQYNKAESVVQDIYNGSTLFEFTNDVDVTKYASLKVKKLFDGTLVDPNETFKFTVTIGSQTFEKSIKANEEWLVSERILAGATYTVTEESSAGYTTTYQVGSDPPGTGSPPQGSGSSFTGTLHADTLVTATFTNTPTGYQLPETGGSGITVYLLIGFALITLPLAVAAKRRKA